MDRIVLVSENREKLICVNRERAEYISVINVLGRGGTSIAYKARKVVNGQYGEWCILKEYYPKSVGYDHYVLYKREKVGGPIKIVVQDDDCSNEEKKDLIRNEIERQKHLIGRENQMINNLRLGNENNLPYVMGGEKIEFQEEMGDTSYLILDTQMGETLHSVIKKNGGKLSFKEAVDYFEKLLEIINVLREKNFCHCDIKGENLWIEGSNANKQMILIDFGSAFLSSDYNVDFDNENRIIELADSIIYDASIGSSTLGYISPLLEDFYEAKEEYILSDEDEKYESAISLIEAIQQLDVSVDLYSGIQLLYRMLTGKIYSMGRLITVEDVVNDSGQSQVVVRQLLKMMKKNEREGYHSIEAVREDLNILKKLESRGAHPEVLLEGLKKDILESSKIDEGLLVDVERIK